MKVSVIMSVWNVQEWLERAVDSILNQTLDNIELICVNDCSPDDSGTILEKYLDNPKFKLITHEVNKGAGQARISGLKEASGEYIMFVDSDDWLELDCIEQMYNTAKQENADIVSCQTYQHDDYKIMGGKETYVRADKYNFLNNKLIAKSIWDKHWYSPLKFREDINSLDRCFYLSNKQVFMDYVGYNYNLRHNSLTSSKDDMFVKNLVYNGLAFIENLDFFPVNSTEYAIAFQRVYSQYNVLKNINIKDRYQDEIKYIIEYVETLIKKIKS